MDNYSKIYWLTRLDALQGLFVTMVTIAGILISVFAIIRLVDYDDDFKLSTAVKKYKWIVFLMLFTGTIGIIFIPTKNEMLLIFAGGETLNYIEKDTRLQKIPQQTTKIISEYLDNKIKELERKD